MKFRIQRHDNAEEYVPFIGPRTSRELKRRGIYIGTNCTIESTAIIRNDAIIGSRSSIGAGVVVGLHTTIGSDTVLGEKVGTADHVNIGPCCTLCDRVFVYSHAVVQHGCTLEEGACVDVGATLKEQCQVTAHVMIPAHAYIKSGVKIRDSRDVLVMLPLGSRRDKLTAYRHGKQIIVNTGCFTGSLADFYNAVTDEHAGNVFYKEYMAAIDFIEKKFALKYEAL